MSDFVSILRRFQYIPEFVGLYEFSFDREEWSKGAAWADITKVNRPTLTITDSRGFEEVFKPAGSGFRKDHDDTYWRYTVVKWVRAKWAGIKWERMPEIIYIDGRLFKLTTWWGFKEKGERVEVTGYHHHGTRVLTRG